MIGEQQMRDLIGATLIDNEGNKVGKIGQLYLDDQSGRPEWVCVKTGMLGTKESFVPVAEATLSGDEVRVPYGKSQIKDAPNMDADGHLDESQEDDLYRYYGLAGGAGMGSAGMNAGTMSGRSGTGMSDADTSDADMSQPTMRSESDDAMTRSEERLHTGTETRATGRARLRRWVDTENVQVEVPVKKEKARLETEPITDANRDAALSGADLSEGEHEVTLSEERPVVNKETVPVERVRLAKDVETDTETVSEDVRKERVAAEGDVVDLTDSEQRDRTR
jgi:uncharacterized protein (TIGR02271 family)